MVLLKQSESGQSESGQSERQVNRMGTNYYVVPNRPSVHEPIHIGKSSIGWMFNFQSQHDPWHEPPIEWNTFEQVRDWLYKNTVQSNEFVIMDEYDKIIPFDELMELIEDKQNDPYCRDNPDNFDGYTRNVNGYRFSDGYFL